MTSWDEHFQAAESLRKSGEYEEAERLFRNLWQEHPTAAAGAGWIHCLRKLKRNREGVEISNRVLESFPDNGWVRIEDEWARKALAWSIYADEVKPAKQQKDLGRITYYAQKMLELTNDPVATKTAVFAVVGVAKDCGRWEIVSAWCDRIDREQLNVDSTEPKRMADRKLWYFDKLKALVKLHKWTEVRTLAQEASLCFPREINFHRWAALALAGLGDVAGSRDEFESIVHYGNAPWYILKDLATINLRLGDHDEALRNACKAALTPERENAKIRLFDLLAQIQLKRGSAASAERHIELVKLIRQREGWAQASDLVQLERQVQGQVANVGIANAPLGLPQLFKLCRRDWEEGAIAGQVRHVGHVSRLIDGKDFAFIAPEMGGDGVYVKLRDLPHAAQKVNARVEYSLVNAYDKKKERDTVRATYVRLLE